MYVSVLFLTHKGYKYLSSISKIYMSKRWTSCCQTTSHFSHSHRQIWCEKLFFQPRYAGASRAENKPRNHKFNKPFLLPTMW